MYLFLGCQIDTSKMAALVEWVFSSAVTQRTSPIMSYPSETFLNFSAILSRRHTWRFLAKIARCARCGGHDFRRLPRSAYKIADIWHVRYRRLNSRAFAKCARSRDLLPFPLRVAGKINQSSWAILSQMTLPNGGHANYFLSLTQHLGFT